MSQESLRWKSASNTVQNTLVLEHAWTIKNFKNMDPEKLETQRICSAAFPEEPKDGIQFQLELNKKKSTDGSTTNPSYGMFLKNVGTKDRIITMFKLFVVDQEGNRVNLKNDLKKTFLSTEDPSWGIPTFVSQAELLALPNVFSQADEALTLGCEVAVTLGITNAVPKYVSRKRKASSLCSDLGESRKLGLHSDVVLQVGETAFPGHKHVLATRSKVFGAMFEHQPEKPEATENPAEQRFEIGDTTPEVFEEFLSFVYSDQSPKLKEFAFELYVLAEKYDVENLKVAAEEELANGLTVDNVAGLLIFLDEQKNEELELKALTFAVAHYGKIPREKEEWKTLFAKHPDMVSKLMELRFFN